jgi:hypothetical protein
MFVATKTMYTQQIPSWYTIRNAFTATLQQLQMALTLDTALCDPLVQYQGQIQGSTLG